MQLVTIHRPRPFVPPRYCCAVWLVICPGAPSAVAGWDRGSNEDPVPGRGGQRRVGPEEPADARAVNRHPTARSLHRRNHQGMSNHSLKERECSVRAFGPAAKFLVAGCWYAQGCCGMWCLWMQAHEPAATTPTCHVWRLEQMAELLSPSHTRFLCEATATLANTNQLCLHGLSHMHALMRTCLLVEMGFLLPSALFNTTTLISPPTCPSLFCEL